MFLAQAINLYVPLAIELAELQHFAKRIQLLQTGFAKPVQLSILG